MKPSRVIQTDVLVVGAGLIGSSVAMCLAQLGCSNVLTVDLDLAGEWSSSELNAGGVRATFSHPVNLLTSKHSIEYYAKHADEVGYRDCGYLWLHRESSWKGALKAREMHVAHGWPVDVLDVNQLKTKVPFIDKTDDLVGGLFGVRDGLVNPNRLKEHYREQATAKGAKFLDGVWVCGAGNSGGRVTIRAFQFSEQLSSERKKQLLCENPEMLTDESGDWIEIQAKQVVNAAGAWAPHFAKLLSYSSPSVPVRRQISLFHARDFDLTPYGMIIDPSGVYFHPEAIYGLSGYANHDEPVGFDFRYDGDKFFQEYIWPSLYERATVFESLKHVSGWSGLYENSPDHHAIVGAVKGLPQILEAHSFSGRGAMQSYGAGLALAELIVKGRYESLDLSELSGERFAKGQPLANETWVI